MHSRLDLLGDVNLRILLDIYRRSHSKSKITSSNLSEKKRGGIKSLEINKNKPTLLVSACLLGENVTYRGGSCASCVSNCSPIGFILNYLYREQKYIECIPICPEMDILNLPSPRPPLRLVKNLNKNQNKDVVMLILGTSPYKVLPFNQLEIMGKKNNNNNNNNKSIQARLQTRHPRLIDELFIERFAGIDGCIFKARSPSCGVGDARLYNSEIINNNNNNNNNSQSYEKVDGFFVHEWVRPAMINESNTGKLISIPVTTERQLKFDDDDNNNNNNNNIHGVEMKLQRKNRNTYGLLSFIKDVQTRFESRIK